MVRLATRLDARRSRRLARAIRCRLDPPRSGKAGPTVLRIARARNAASSGNELFKRTARIDVVHVPYKGFSPALTDLMAGRIDYMIDNVGLLARQVSAGKIRALAITGPKRVAAAPDVPTMAEAGMPDTNSRPGWAWRFRRARSGNRPAPQRGTGARAPHSRRAGRGSNRRAAKSSPTRPKFAPAVRSEQPWREIIQEARSRRITSPATAHFATDTASAKS